MSRSYKKVCNFNDRSTGKQYFKRLSNKKIRKMKDVPMKFGRWKHITRQTYNICDYSWCYWSKREIKWATEEKIETLWRKGRMK